MLYLVAGLAFFAGTTFGVILFGWLKFRQEMRLIRMANDERERLYHLQTAINKTANEIRA